MGNNSSRMRTVRPSLRAIPNRGGESTPSTTQTNAINMPASSKGKTLITFDVDGTLIRASGKDANKFHKDAFMHGFREVYGGDAPSGHRRHSTSRFYRSAHLCGGDATSRGRGERHRRSDARALRRHVDVRRRKKRDRRGRA